MSDLETANGLINVLLDRKADLAERDDAAMDLGEFDTNSALIALYEIAKDSSEDDVLLASCGESIAQIWLRHEHYDFELLKQFQPIAKQEAMSLIKAKNEKLLSNGL